MWDHSGTTPGGCLLVRTAGLPIRMWLDAADSDLAFRIRCLVDAEQRHTVQSKALAVEIGAVLVPDPAMNTAQRREVLACRRKLHAGALVTLDAVSALSRSCGHEQLAQRAEQATELSKWLAAEQSDLTTAISDEYRRLLATPWTAITNSPIGRRALADGIIAAGADIEARVRRGESWECKRLRQRSDYLWRMIARGAAKTTPRSWLGHVALANSGPPGEFALTDAVASRWTENVHSVRVSLADPADGVRVGFAPLHRVDGDQLQVWLVRPDEEVPIQPITIPLPAELYAALRSGARPLEEVAVAADFALISRLVEMGVCEARRPVQSRRTGWQGSTEASPAGFVDVYRRSQAGWPTSATRQLEAALGIVHRINSLMTADTDNRMSVPPGVTDQPRPVLEVLFEQLDAADAPDPDNAEKHMPSTWPTAARQDSGYAKLLAELPPHCPTFDITDELLDRLGAQPASYRWPVDCLVRPSRNGDVALDMVACAGMLDARFVSELTSLHGSLSHVDAHREFIRLVDAQTAVRSVEYLAPALSELAANAVHRPLYTSAWTGDPDLAAYCGPGQADYIPLHSITVRRGGNRLLTEVDGAPIRILYHATRLPPPPFHRLLALLLNGDTSVSTQFRRLRHALAALPGHQRLPRITVANSVIISPAQWLLPPNALAGSTDLERAKAVARLRDRLGLPRWVMACAGFGGRPFPCDLDSLRAATVLESLVSTAAGEPVVLEEMAPAPDELPVDDATNGGLVASELLIRLPHNISAETLARQTARALAGDTVSWAAEASRPAELVTAVARATGVRPQDHHDGGRGITAPDLDHQVRSGLR